MSAVLTRRLNRAALLVASWLLLAAVAQAATPITVTASPKTVSRGQKVTLTLKRSLPFGALPIATVNLRTAPKTSGTFSTSWVVPASVHSGLRTIVATQRCESGKNGSLVLITRSTTVRVR
jgi:hypothetical protein